MNVNLGSFIETIFQDFSGKIPDDVYTKLLILKFIDNGKTPDDICSEIKKQQKNGLLSKDNIIKSESLYRKIRRIKKDYTKIYELPYLIQIKKLVHIIMAKYPQPSYRGFPFDYWDGNNMYDFIHYYFKFPEGMERMDKIKSETLQKYINNSKTQNFIIKQNQINTFYYITIIIKRYINIPISHVRNKQYNYLYYGAIFMIDDNHLKKVKDINSSVSVSVNFTHTFQPLISKLLKQIPNGFDKNTVIFIHKIKEYESIFFRREEDFHEYFRFYWCPYNNYKDLQKKLNDNRFHINPSTINNLQNIFNQLNSIEESCSKIAINKCNDFISFKDEKTYYVEEINKIFSAIC